MGKRILTNQSICLMRYLLEDEQIHDKVLNDSKNKDKYKTCTIYEDGTVVLGRTSITFLNQLLACQDKIPFEAFALRVWDALVAMSTGENSIALQENLSTEIAKLAQREGEYNTLVTRLANAYDFICNNKSGSNGTSAGEGGTASMFGPVLNDSLRKRLRGGIKMTYTVKDSIGDDFLNLGYTLTDVEINNGKQ